MYLNKAIIIGNLTRDPELKSLPSGMQVASFSLATNRVWKDKSGAKQESSDYHNVVIFGKQAESCQRYLHKGDSALIEGRLQTRSWDGADGKKNYRTEIVADRVQFGPKKQGSGDSKAEPAAREPKSNEVAIEYPEEEVNPEDIPF